MRFALPPVAVLALGLAACRPSTPEPPPTGAAPPADVSGPRASPPPDSALPADPAPSAPAPASGPVPFDPVAGTVGGVDFDRPGPELVTANPGLVQAETTFGEDDTVTVYVARFSAGAVRKQARLVSFTSPHIQTTEGLGVGKTVGQFGEVFGHTEIVDMEGGWCFGAPFAAGPRRLNACVERGCTQGTCPVTEVQFVTER